MATGFLPVPVSWGDDVEHRRLLANGVNSLRDGKINATGEFTLDTSTTTTAVTDNRVGGDSTIVLMPTTANAAGALATLYIGTVDKQTFTVTHANNAQADRTFKYAVLG